jgi:hypothetical protein
VSEFTHSLDKFHLLFGLIIAFSWSVVAAVEAEAVGIFRGLLGYIWKQFHKEPPGLWLEYISSGQPWHNDEIILRCDGPGRAIDIRVDDFLAEDIVWHRRIAVPSLGAGDSVRVEAQVAYGRYEIGYMHRILRNNRQVELPVTFCDLHGTEYTRNFVLRQETNTSSAISVSLGKLSRRNRTLEKVKKLLHLHST